MDINIKKSKRAKGIFFQKARLGQSKAKKYAMSDISEFCKKNYCHYEYLILSMSKI